VQTKELTPMGLRTKMDVLVLGDWMIVRRSE